LRHYTFRKTKLVIKQRIAIMAISIRLGNPLVAEIDKEGFRRLVRFAVSGGSRSYGVKARLASRGISGARTLGQYLVRRSAVAARAAQEEYGQQVDTGEAALLGEKKLAGWQEGTYNSTTTLKSGDAKSIVYMNRGWSIVSKDEDRGAMQASVRSLLCLFDPDGKSADTSGGSSDESTLLQQTGGQKISAEALKTDIFDDDTKKLLATLTHAEREKVVELLCPSIK
jgi:hypothetical protein